MKLVNDETLHRIPDTALRIHDDAGVMMNTDINKLLQIARNLRIPDGSDESQRATIAETIGLRFKN